MEVKERVDIDLLDHCCGTIEFVEEDLRARERAREGAGVRVEIRFVVCGSIVVCLEAREFRMEEKVAIWKGREAMSEKW